MREIVIVIGDLYLEPELTARQAVSDSGASWGSPPAIEHLARFGDKKIMAGGWRAWVAHWLTLEQYAGEPPASVAAAAVAGTLPDRTVWLATPMRLIAGLTSLHLDRRSVLRLAVAELEELAASFRDTFRGSGFELHPLDGDFLLSGPKAAAPSTTAEPARMLLTSVAEALPAGEGAPALRRLNAEIEMWLHGHSVNEERARRGAPPVTTLWLWGGGAPVSPPPAAPRETAALAFGSDAYVRGLWRLAGGETRPMPVDWAALIGQPRARRVLGVVEVAGLLHANASWRLADAMAEIDCRLLAPSLAALHRGELDRLVLLANDRSFTLHAADRWRLWRRVRTLRSGFEALA